MMWFPLSSCLYYWCCRILLIAIFFVNVVLLTGCGGTMSQVKILKPTDNHQNECVILLHGLGRTNDSLKQMQNTLVQAGYHTVNLDYPSRKKNIEQLAAEYIPMAIEQCNSYNPTRIHFVTHSLGGILVRVAMKNNRPDNLGRVVMLSPPNNGSEAVDALKDRWYFSWFNGPAGQQLSTTEDSVPNQLGPVDYPVGIITGDRHAFFDSWLLKLFRGANDGKVSVESAQLEGMSDFLVVHSSHPYIMNSDYVECETVYFLQNGFFLHEKE